MKITDISINKPIALSMVVVLFLMMGMISYFKISSELFPTVKTPIIQVTSKYPGASAEAVEEKILKRIEDSVADISGLDKINSTAVEGAGWVTLKFKANTDVNTAFMDVQKAVETVIEELPKEATRPAILKYNPDAIPILILSVAGGQSQEELNNAAAKIKEKLERVQGIGGVTVYGAIKKELTVRADKEKLNLYNVTLDQISRQIQSENIKLPGGIINQPEQDRIVSINGEAKNPEEIEDIRIPSGKGYVRLGGIAAVDLGYPREKEFIRVNGQSAVIILVQQQAGANMVETGTRAREALAEIKDSIKGIEVKTIHDSSVFITSALNETKRNLIEGIITTCIVLFVFLRQWKSTLIAMVAIPTSLVATFFMMYALGFSFNILSLMGLALCIGILVDDSVVVLENIHRHLKMGKDPITAARDGRSEIGMAAIAITLGDVVVFAPIAFMSGMVGQYFKQFGLVVVVATLFSLLVSFTVTPAMASRMFHPQGYKKARKSIFDIVLEHSERVFGKLETRLEDGYIKLLKHSLQHRKKVLLMMVIMLVMSLSLVFTGLVGTEFMPATDEGEININLALTPGTSLKEADEKARQLEERIKTLKELKFYYIQVGNDNQPNKVTYFLKLEDKKNRSRSDKEVTEELRKWTTDNINGAEVVFVMPNSSDSNSKAINYGVKGPEPEVTKEIARKVAVLLRETPGTTDVGSTSDYGKPGYSIRLDRARAAQFGISALDVNNAINSGLEGIKAGTIKYNNGEYNIRVRLDKEELQDENDIKNLWVTGSNGVSVPIGQIADIAFTNTPTAIDRQDRQRVTTVSCNIADGFTMGNLSRELQKKLAAMQLPQGYSISYGAEQKEFDETFTALLKVLALSIVLVYMLLVVLYESFLTPAIRLLALPVGFIGAIPILFLTSNTLNLMSMIGLIMLDGLAAKNGTLLVDYTNTLMNKGMAIREALLLAGKTRLKPILMTSLAMIVGMIPAALAFGDGSEFKSSMALVVIGGIISSTVLSPILLPVAYSIIHDFSERRKAKKIIQNGAEI